MQSEPMAEAATLGARASCREGNLVDAQLGSTTALARRLQEACRRDELDLALQPIVWMGSGELRGVEALLRWPGGPGPDVFVPVAEAHGLIEPLGRWVLSRALDAAVRLSASLGRTLPVSVNVSARQLGDVTFRDHVEAELCRTGMPGSALSLELTETAAIHDPLQAAAMLGALADLGCPIGLDDFGTGWSTLSLVSVLPLDFLKLDRSFVAALHTPAGATVSRVIIRLGRELGLDVIAEGVETPCQAALLADLGCHAAQGYLYGRPTLHHEQIVAGEAAAASRR